MPPEKTEQYYCTLKLRKKQFKNQKTITLQMIVLRLKNPEKKITNMKK